MLRTACSTAALSLCLCACSEFEFHSKQPAAEVTETTPGAALKITPESLDFGGIPVPCSDADQVVLESVGDAPLTIHDIDYASNGMLTLTDDLAAALPITLAPGETRALTVSFDPNVPDIDFGTLTVKSDDPFGPRKAYQKAEGTAGDASDHFTEPSVPPVDILFLIDQSCSMAALADDNIRSGMPGLIDELQTVADWQMIEVTKSDGCANGGVLTPTTPNAATLLADNAFNVLIPGLYTEQLLKHADTALAQTGPGGCNDGFLRQGASLHILIASDEPDQSPNTWQSWLTAYEGYVANPSLVKVSGILNVFSNDACSDFNGGAPDRYIDVVNATSGVALDICQPGWGSQLTDIATAAVAGIRVYTLTYQAAGPSIHVYVNGVETTDFDFSAATNSVTVNSPLIDVGDEVDIDYLIVGECTAP